RLPLALRAAQGTDRPRRGALRRLPPALPRRGRHGRLPAGGHRRMTSPTEYLFTSESVTEGHPDKVAAQISDAVPAAVLLDAPVGRVACETLVNTGLVVVSGEISTTTYVDIQEV